MWANNQRWNDGEQVRTLLSVDALVVCYPTAPLFSPVSGEKIGNPQMRQAQ
jgi:hypothetical protein